MGRMVDEDVGRHFALHRRGQHACKQRTTQAALVVQALYDHGVTEAVCQVPVADDCRHTATAIDIVAVRTGDDGQDRLGLYELKTGHEDAFLSFGMFQPPMDLAFNKFN